MVELDANKAQHTVEPNMQPLSPSQRSHILSLLIEGHSAHQISSSTGVSYTSITRLRSKHLPDLPKPTGGHPSKLSPSNMRFAQRLISSGKADNAVQVTKALQSITNQPLSSQTTRRYLRQHGMKAVVKKKRPLLLPRHKQQRLDFALTHKDWTVEDWKRVVWSDETKINRLGSDGRKWVWKKAGEGLSERTVEGTVKFGGGCIMVWGCMLWEGVGYACKIDGKMDADLYCKILEDDLQSSIDYYGKTAEDIIFQQDNDPKHTSKKAKAWFNNHEYQVLSWPAQSPDLNPIEHLWYHLKRRLAEYEEQPKGMIELWERVEVEWSKIGVEVCQNLIESMPRRVQAVLEANGGYTKY
jgi:transposase